MGVTEMLKNEHEVGNWENYQEKRRKKEQVTGLEQEKLCKKES